MGKTGKYEGPSRDPQLIHAPTVVLIRETLDERNPKAAATRCQETELSNAM